MNGSREPLGFPVPWQESLELGGLNLSALAPKTAEFTIGKASCPTTFDVLSWDDPAAGVPLLATMTPQEAVNQGLGRPADCDITIVILWSWLGSPLRGDAFRKPDGEPYWSGTEWEYEDARTAGRDVLVY
jgi:hypothetical protein